VSGLLPEPAGPLTQFLRWGGIVFGVLVFPAGFMLLLHGDSLGDVLVAIGIVLTPSLLAGLGGAGWSLLQAWAYRKLSTKSDPW